MKFRHATVKDAPEIAAMHAISWRQTYPGFLPESWIDRQSYNFRKRRDHWAEFIAGPNNGALWVAETAEGQEGALVGFGCWWSRSRDQEHFPHHAELSALYLLNAFQKQGIGARLFTLGREEMAARGFERCYAWTLEHGPSRIFYERMGLCFQGQKKTRDWDGQSITEIAMEGPMRRPDSLSLRDA